MTPQERQLIDELFERLSRVEGAARDPDAVAAIAQGLRKAPNAVYALVQTVLVQDEALKRANSRIQEFTPSGTVLNTWGTGGAEDGNFTNVVGIAVDVAGNVYAADEGNSRIEKFFTGLDPCTNLFSPHLSPCQTAKAVCMAKLAPQDEASCLNATKVQYDAFRGQHAADHATVTAKSKKAKKSGHIVLLVQLTAAGSPASGKKIHLTLSGLRLRIPQVHIAPATVVTNSVGKATFTLTSTPQGAGSYHVSVVDVTDGKTFANVVTVGFS